MQLKKICPRCRGRMIDADKTCCDWCQEKRNARHKEYDRLKRDQKARAFYHSKSWVRLRDHIMMMAGGIDLYELHENKRIAEATVVHHIIELEEDWSRRLDPANLIPLSHKSHAKIHKLYKEDKKNIQRLLFEIKEGRGQK